MHASSDSGPGRATGQADPLNWIELRAAGSKAEISKDGSWPLRRRHVSVKNPKPAFPRPATATNETAIKVS